jgi:hypothetical protein
MGYRACISEIIAAAGRQLSDDELDDLLSQLQRRIDAKRKLSAGEDLDRAVTEAADEFATEMTEAAKIEKRNAAINLRRRLEAMDFVRTGFGDNPALGMESLLVGVNRPVKGARRSVAQEQTALKNYYLGGMLSDFERAGLWKTLTSGQMDREISRALWARNRAEPRPSGVPVEADRAAAIISKWQDVARRDANDAGAWIKRLEGYITRQSHDAVKIRRAGFEAWRDAILPKLDLARTLDGDTDSEAFLKAVYQGLASGVHLKAAAEGSGFKGPRNIAKKVSAERVLHFKDADSWFDYNLQFGIGSLRQSILRSLESTAEATGLMRRLGTNPESNFNQIVDELTRGIEDPGRRQKFADAARGKLRNQLLAVDGSTRIPVNHLGAAVASGVRAIENWAKLGGALLSQFSDVPTYGSEMRYQGDGMLSGVLGAVQGLFKGRNRAEMAEIDGMIGVVMDGMIGDATSRFSIAEDGLPGGMSRLQQFFFKINGMTWWTDSLRASAARAMSHRLALNVGRGFDTLDPDLQRVLRLYAIEGGEWEAIRQAATKEADGRAYVAPDAVMDLPDEALSGILAARDLTATPRRLRSLKRELADKLRLYFVDRAEYAVISPDARTRAMMQRGTQPGTVEGETLRFIGQFKSFSAAFTQKAIGREIYGRGANSLREALRNGNGEMLGLAQLILWTTAFGYASMAAKDLAKGRTPRDPLDKATWAAAMVQGGGMGIYGDFLFGEMRNRFGGGFLATVAGPTLGTIDDLADLWGRVRNGDDSAAAAFRVAINNTPFLNLFYTRIALDYLILYQMQEWLNPGSLRRLERQVERENGQTFLVRPSSVAR